MKGVQRNCDSASRLIAEKSQNVNNRPNRLSRSFRQTQQPTSADIHSPKSSHIEFKTPTRLHKSKSYTSSFTSESPHSDSDFQQDIIWDPTSPTIRTGKSIKNHSSNGGVVDISAIVNRIAPKYGRPRVAEPTLQQWIGDSATILCTPDVQHPKFKRKSPRLNAVDDLLKLAKQFDLNMFQQDKEEADNDSLRSLELISEDILDMDSQEDVLQPTHPETSLTAKDTSTGREAQLHHPLDQHMENDLDFLFDGPTQQISGRLSQTSLCRPSEVKPTPTAIPKEASGKATCSSQCPTPTVTTTYSKGASTVVDFEDDWENDDFLNDPLLFETPHTFSPPKHSSTQRGPSDGTQDPLWSNGPPDFSANQNGTLRTEKQTAQSNAPEAEREIGKHRLTFRLEETSDFQVKKIVANTAILMSKSEKDAVSSIKQSSASSSNVFSIKTSSQHNRQMQPLNKLTLNPKDSLYSQRAAFPTTSIKHTTFPHEDNSMKHSQAPVASGSLSQKPVWQKDQPVVPSLGKCDLDDDLDSLFSSDWDDMLDDDLLCEMCDDLESQAKSTVGQPVAKQSLPVSQPVNQRLPLAPSKRAWDVNNPQTEVKHLKQVSINSQSYLLRGTICMQSSPDNVNSQFVTRGSAFLPSNSAAVNSASNNTASLCVSSGKESSRQDLNSHLTCNTTTYVTSGTQIQVKNTHVEKNHFTFKKPSTPVLTVASTSKCSAVEIEHKKQQAMERRRQRMQATQNLGTAS